MQAAEQTQKLLNLVEQRDRAGHPTYSDAEVRHLLPLLILTSGFKPRNLPGPAQEVLGVFVAKAKLDLELPPAQLRKAINAYYVKHPPNPSLMHALSQFLKNPDGAIKAAAWAVARVSSGGWGRKP